MATIEKGIEILGGVEAVGSNGFVKLCIGMDKLIAELQRAENIKIIYEICDRREEEGTESFRMNHG